MESNNQTVALHPDNPRYLTYNGKPVVLLTSTEHYGAVTNTAFDYEKYLDMLQSHGLNLTRIVILLREAEGEFKGFLGRQNTLSPTKDHYEGPWARSRTPGCYDGGCKFDLEVWNERFFERIRNFCREADQRGIVVEITFFSQYYSNKADSAWSWSPLNPINNVQGIGASDFNRFTGLGNKALVGKQEAMVRKVVSVMKDAGNVYYEICNEPPYPDDVEGEPADDHPGALGAKAIDEWQSYIGSVIADEEKDLQHKHLIAVGDPHEDVEFDRFSIYNFHYRAWMEKGLAKYFSHRKPLAFDETLTGIVSWNREMDFDGRRKEMWEFIMRGSSVYDYLDFTIATDDPRGEGQVELPGGYVYDGTMMRHYLKYLGDFIHGFDFVQMAPDDSLITSISDTAQAFVLAEKGRAYAVYINGSALKSITVDLPEGIFRAEWFNPLTGVFDKVEEGISGGGQVRLDLPLYHADIALKLKWENKA